jgi:hypothetical protein
MAQAILHSLANVTQRVSHSLECAIYELDSEDHLLYRRLPRWPLELHSREVFVFGLPPRSGGTVDPGAVLARFACGQPLAGPDGRTLTAFGRSVGSALRQAFQISNHDDRSEDEQ